jgi:thymidylate synthase ThyX
MSYKIDGAPYDASRPQNDLRVSGLTKDVAFNRKAWDGGNPRNPADNGQIQVGLDGIQVRLVQGINEDDFRRTLSRAVNATRGVDLDDPPEEIGLKELWEETGLETVFESQVVVFEVAGVSRTCTHQLVRSRRAAFHQQSQRAHYYGEKPEVRIPESMWIDPEVRRAYVQLKEASDIVYNMACEHGISYQDARFALLEGTTNYVVLEYPIREFIAVYAYRACPMFQAEICHVVRECKRVLVEAHPWIDPYIKISCERTEGALDKPYDPEDPGTHRHCTFRGWEEVEGQCEFPYARETNRSFRSKRFAITKAK